MRKDTRYTPEYKEKCFITWYSAGRPPYPSRIQELVPIDEYGRKPSTLAIKAWMRSDTWEIRADELDSKAMVLVENELITQKAEMLRRQAETGFTLQHLGMQYLISGSFDSSSAAVQAVIRGAELERSSRGIGEVWTKMAKMTDAELEQEIIKQLTRATDAGQIIEGEEVEDTDSSTDE